MIDILLASYNGEKYIGKQIDSLLSQTYKDWFLYIKDDCSTDDTINIIKGYEKRYKDKIKVILSDKPTGSAKNNFFSLLQYSTSSYVMFCDQDDVWLPEKIQLTYNKMKEIEKENVDIPILVHTDLKVTDDKLNVISDSLLKMQNLDYNRDKLNNLLVQNIVTGCTIMVNRNLLKYIIEIPQYAIMHDWWMALIASTIGKIGFINKPTILYRQHNENNVGAKNVKSLNYILGRLKDIKSVKLSLQNTYLQSGELNNVICNYIDRCQSDMIIQYSLLKKYDKLNKIKVLNKYGLWKNSLIKVVGQIIFC